MCFLWNCECVNEWTVKSQAAFQEWRNVFRTTELEGIAVVVSPQCFAHCRMIVLECCTKTQTFIHLKFKFSVLSYDSAGMSHKDPNFYPFKIQIFGFVV